MMKKLPWLAPLVWSKLPSLARRHNAYHAVPCICAKLGQRLHTVHDKVTRVGLGFFTARVDVCPFAVDGDEVFGPGVTLGSRTVTGILGGLKAV
jgi:hypothetical protein